jgi:hypothetical protein
VAQQRVDARDGFGSVESCRDGRDPMRGERGLRSWRNWLLRQRMRQGLECGLVLEGEVRAFVRFDQD